MTGKYTIEKDLYGRLDVLNNLFVPTIMKFTVNFELIVDSQYKLGYITKWDFDYKIDLDKINTKIVHFKTDKTKRDNIIIIIYKDTVIEIDLLELLEVQKKNLNQFKEEHTRHWIDF